MDKSYKESVVRAFPKEDIAAFNFDEGLFFAVMQNGLCSLAERREDE